MGHFVWCSIKMFRYVHETIIRVKKSRFTNFLMRKRKLILLYFLFLVWLLFLNENSFNNTLAQSSIFWNFVVLGWKSFVFKKKIFLNFVTKWNRFQQNCDNFSPFKRSLALTYYTAFNKLKGQLQYLTSCMSHILNSLLFYFFK